ncbi:MAG: hypothetical protein M3O20_05330 [Acidobacteriota bacterium]|nr:hypothetical protein [Acidobacteriota bacterium]
MKRETLDALLAVMLTLQLAFWPAVAIAASPAIGTIRTPGAFRLNHATLINNATLFEGATIETASAVSHMDLVSGTRLELGTGSRGRFFGDHLVLERGQSIIQKAQGFRVEARGLTILPDTGASTGSILLQGPARVQVSAATGSFRVLNSRGSLVAKIYSGRTLLMEPQSSDGPMRLSGRVVLRGGHYLLTDETTNVTVELAAGKSVASAIGRRVEVTGVSNPAAIPASDATQVIEVAQVTPAPPQPTAPAGSGGSTGGSGGGTAAGGSAGGAPRGAAVSVTLVAIIAGVAAAGVVGGLAATGSLGGGAAAPVSR